MTIQQLLKTAPVTTLLLASFIGLFVMQIVTGVDANNPSTKALLTWFAASPNLSTAEHSYHWWLLGTAGCHLCDIAEQIIRQFQAVQPITYQNVDIADFDEPLMMTFATTIPVILTPSQRLDYPFSVMDLQQLLTH